MLVVVVFINNVPACCIEDDVTAVSCGVAMTTSCSEKRTTDAKSELSQTGTVQWKRANRAVCVVEKPVQLSGLWLSCVFGECLPDRLLTEDCECVPASCGDLTGCVPVSVYTGMLVTESLQPSLLKLPNMWGVREVFYPG